VIDRDARLLRGEGHERRGQLAHALEATVAVALQAAEHDLVEALGHVLGSSEGSGGVVESTSATSSVTFSATKGGWPVTRR